MARSFVELDSSFRSFSQPRPDTRIAEAFYEDLFNHCNNSGGPIVNGQIQREMRT